MKIPYALRKKTGFQYLLDQMNPQSPYGAELARRPHWHAPKEGEALLRAHENVAAAMRGLVENKPVYDKLSRQFMQVRDLRGTFGHLQETVLTEVELFEIKRFLLQLGQIAALFADEAGGYCGIYFTEEKEALALLDPKGRRAAGFAIGPEFAGPLAEIREEKRQIEAKLRDEGDGPLRSTLLNERRLIIAREESEMLAARQRLTEALRPYGPALLQNAQMIGRLDFAIQKAELARRFDMVRPAIVEDAARFDGMHNPKLAALLSERGEAFTCVSLEAPLGATVITGANMGGKSVALETFALNVLLCHTGFFACAKRAETPLFDALHMVCDDLSDEAAGLSSFGAEIVKTQEILQAVHGGAFCCIALDEPARGTNPREGAALVQALVEHLSGERVVAVVATHYDGVAAHAQAHYQAAGLAKLPDRLPEGNRLAFVAKHMNYGLVRVRADERAPHEALTISRLLGLDARVLDRMEALLDEAETSGG